MALFRRCCLSYRQKPGLSFLHESGVVMGDYLNFHVILRLIDETQEPGRFHIWTIDCWSKAIHADI